MINEERHVSFQVDKCPRLTSENSLSTKHYLLSKKLSSTIDLSIQHNQERKQKRKEKNKGKNIFQLTSDHHQSEYSLLSDSRLGTQQKSPSKYSLILNDQFKSKKSENNPQKSLVLPIITESKYNFRPSINFNLPKVSKKQTHEKDSKYLIDNSTINMRNLKKMRNYRKLWDNNALKRKEKSLLEHSQEKSQKLLFKHNQDVKERKHQVDFYGKLRDRHIKQDNRIGNIKGMPQKNIPGLKGKGKSEGSLFQKYFCVEEVYKFDNSK